MHAKSLKFCLTDFDPVDCSLPGSSVLGILQARILDWLPCPPAGDLPYPEIKPVSPALADRFFTTSMPWEAPGVLGPKKQADCQLPYWAHLCWPPLQLLCFPNGRTLAWVLPINRGLLQSWLCTIHETYSSLKKAVS